MFEKEAIERIRINLTDIEPLVTSAGGGFGRLDSNMSLYKKNSLLYLYLKNYEESRQSFLKAAYINLMFHDLRFSNKFPHIDKKHLPSYPSGVNGEPFQTVMCCGNEAMLLRFFEHINLSPKEYNSDYNSIATMVKKGLITQNQAILDLHSVQLRKKKVENLRGFEKGDLMCLMGILNKDINEINQGVDFLIKACKRDQATNAIKHSTALWATAMVRLARRLGFEPDLSNSYISKEVVFWEDVSFEPDEELKSYEKQLEEINTPGWVFDPSKDQMSEAMTTRIEEARQEEKAENAKKGFFRKLFGL
jgi:hypothetical protein